MVWKLIGGARGIVLVVALASIGTLVPARIGARLLEPAILLVYAVVAALFSSQLAAGAAVGVEDEQLARRITLGSALYGWACWVVILGVALAALWRSRGPAIALPWLLLCAEAVFALAASWFMAAVAAWAAASVYTVKAARDMMRLGVFFIAGLAWLIVPARVLQGGMAPINLTIASILLGCAGALILRRALRAIAEKREGLSITGEWRAKSE